MGRVHVKVKGAVSLGDLIVPSDEAGVGRAFVSGDKESSIVGTAIS